LCPGDEAAAKAVHTSDDQQGDTEDEDFFEGHDQVLSGLSCGRASFLARKVQGTVRSVFKTAGLLFKKVNQQWNSAPQLEGLLFLRGDHVACPIAFRLKECQCCPLLLASPHEMGIVAELRLEA
jgi:hypothetical protein